MNGYKKEDILVVIFILAFLISVIFMCTSRDNVHDNGHGVDNVRDELTNAQAAQQEETSVIDETKQSIDRSQKGIDDSEQANREIASVEQKDAEIVDECEQILARVRARGGKENQNQNTTEKFMDSGFHRTGNIGNKVTFEKTMCEIKKEHKKNEGTRR